jgi:DNA-directed RNA polymerase specialized sigma24 family protein
MDTSTIENGTAASRAVIDTVAKYFYFASLDEHISFTASLKALTDLKHNDWLDRRHRSRWVQVLSKWKLKLNSLRGKAWSEDSHEKGFSLPKDFDLQVWANFLQTGEATEVEAVLFSKILNFSEEEIAEGLGVTTGTVRYRVGRGLRHLGGYIEP